MADIDMSKPAPRFTLNPGVDLWEVVTAGEKKSKKSGDAMFEIELARSSKQTERIKEYIMLEGPGWHLGKMKLAAFIGKDFKGQLDGLDLIGKRVWCRTRVDSYEDSKGEMRESLKIASDPKAATEFDQCGIQHEADVPPGCTLPSAAPF